MRIMNFKIYSIIIVILFTSVFFFGCIEESEFNIKYSSTDIYIPKEKQGKMFFNFTIRSNEETEIAQLWIPYPVSNDYQSISNYSIEGNYDYSGIYREPKNEIMTLYAEWNNPKTFPRLKNLRTWKGMTAIFSVPPPITGIWPAI